MHNCSLCHSNTVFFKQVNEKVYLECTNCKAVQMDPEFYVSIEEEKERYLEHNNDVNDIRYQKFVRPLVNTVLQNFTNQHVGLDFGAGTGPVLTKLLSDSGYQVEKYDPFFWNNPNVLNQTYDFIVSCEVIEHFHVPSNEFKLLRNLLKPSGMLILKTIPLYDHVDFSTWFYLRDQTHVFFYREETFNWIKEHFNFQSLEMNDRLIILKT